MERAYQDHSCTLNTWKSNPKTAGLITVYLVTGYKLLSLAVCENKLLAICSDSLWKYCTSNFFSFPLSGKKLIKTFDLDWIGLKSDWLQEQTRLE